MFSTPEILIYILRERN